METHVISNQDTIARAPSLHGTGENNFINSKHLALDSPMAKMNEMMLQLQELSQEVTKLNKLVVKDGGNSKFSD